MSAKQSSTIVAIVEAMISAYSMRNAPYIVHRTAPEPLKSMVTLDNLSVFPNSCGMEAAVEKTAAIIEMRSILNPELSLIFGVYSVFNYMLFMSRRAATGNGETDTMLSPDIESGKMKTDTIYELMKLRDLQSFVTKIYWLIIMCFFAVGIILALVLSDGTFSDVFMAENLLSSVGISAYIILVVLMMMCNNHNEMRVVLLLTVLFFIGCLSGFMLALHLLDVSITLKSGKV